MALADIIRRIESDAADEAAAILATADARVAALQEDAEKRARALVAEAVARAEREAQRESQTAIANVGLATRDAAVTARRTVLDQTLERARESLAGLPRDTYAQFLAGRVAEQAKGGEAISFGTADADVADAVMGLVATAAPGLGLKPSGEAPFDHGAYLRGDRVRADISLEAIIDDNRSALELAASAVLFGEGE